MHRRAWLLLALAACEPPAPPAAPPAPAWVYAPPPATWPLPGRAGRIGRSQPPQLAPRLGISGSPQVPLRLATPWSVPGDGPARAVIYGLEGTRPAIELVDVDAGRVVWRDTETCAGPIVGVTPDAIVCAEANGTRGLSLDRKSRWSSEAPFVAMTGELVVVGPTGLAVILDAATGDELSRVTLPDGVLAESIVATCGDVGRELFATSTQGTLIRIADAKGGPAIAWAAPIGALEDVDACDGDVVVVKAPGALIALARDTGAQLGRVDGVRGWWRARTGAGLEIATATGVSAWSRDLTSETATPLPPLFDLLATRADRRLVRATSQTAVVLDPDGVRAFVPLVATGAVLGDDAIIAATWVGSQAESVRRIGVPPRYPRALRLPSRGPAVALPAELRDLPAVEALDVASAIARPGAAAHALEAVALDAAATTLYAAALERPARAGIAAIDLARRTWTWHRADACGDGDLVGVAVARDVIVCGARGEPGEGASVRATGTDGAARWEWTTDALDRVQAAGDVVLAHAADRVAVLDAATGRLVAHLASDDGGPASAVALALDEHTTVVIAAERGHLVARLPAIDMVPAWSVAVDGVVRALIPSADGVLVHLEDGDAYRIDARTAATSAIAGLNYAWHARGELVVGTGEGGEVPGAGAAAPGVPPAPLVRRTPKGKPIKVPPELADRPRLWEPIPAPPPLGKSFQLAVYELTGALRVVNDYGLLGAATLATTRGPAGSAVLVAGSGALLVLDPQTGDPVRRVALPDDTPPGAVFSTVVAGRPVTGVALAQPLRVVLF